MTHMDMENGNQPLTSKYWPAHCLAISPSLAATAADDDDYYYYYYDAVDNDM